MYVYVWNAADWDGSKIFPLVIGVYTGILIILAIAISCARGGKSGEYGVSVNHLCIKCQLYIISINFNVLLEC